MLEDIRQEETQDREENDPEGERSAGERGK
jgi:hypothetical protein